MFFRVFCLDVLPMKRPVQYIHLPPDSFPSGLIASRPFSVVVIITADVEPEWRHAVSEWLVQEGCLCMMAWGNDCSLWDDSVDIANLEAHNWGNIPVSQSIMTTWHDDETLSEVFWSADNSIFYWSELEPPSHLVILDISEKAREGEIRELFAKSCVSFPDDTQSPPILRCSWFSLWFALCSRLWRRRRRQD